MLSFLYEKQTASPLDSYEMWINPRFPSKFAFKEHKEKVKQALPEPLSGTDPA